MDGGGLLLQWNASAYNRSTWAHADSSSLMVCVGPSSNDETAAELWRGQARDEQEASCSRSGGQRRSSLSTTRRSRSTCPS